MPSTIHAIVFKNVPDRNILVDSLHVSYTNLDNSFKTRSEIDSFIRNRLSTKYTHIGLIFENNLNILPMFEERMFGPLFSYFLAKIKQVGVNILDLITCDFSTAYIAENIKYLEKKYEINIRYSIDKTGSLTNWVMESDDVDIKSSYFNSNIDTYLHTLGGSSATHMGFVQNVDGERVAKMFGLNSNGQLGSGNTSSTNQLITSLNSDVSKIYRSVDSTIFLKTDGTVWVVGRNEKAKLGLSDIVVRDVNITTPTQVLELTDIIDVACGNKFTLFLKSDGTVYGCGLNIVSTNAGALGLGNTPEVYTPTLIPGLPAISHISASSTSSFFVTSTGEVYVTGQNNTGQLGLSDLVNRNTVTINNNISSVKAIFGGKSCSIFLKYDGTVWGTGLNSYGEIGPTLGMNRPPVQIAGLVDIVEASIGEGHTLFLTSGGQVYSMGYNQYGQIGNGARSSSNVTTPYLISSLSNIKSVNATFNTSFCLTGVGSIVWFGSIIGIGTSSLSFMYNETPDPTVNLLDINGFKYKPTPFDLGTYTNILRLPDSLLEDLIPDAGIGGDKGGDKGGDEGDGGGGAPIDISGVFTETVLVADDFTTSTSKMKGLLDLATDQSSILTTRTLIRQKMQALSVTSFKAIRDGTLLQNVLSVKLGGSEIENFTNVKHIGVIPSQTVTLETTDISTNLPIYFDADVGDSFTISYSGTSYSVNIASSTTIIVNDTTYSLGDTVPLGDKTFQVIGFGSVVLNPVEGGGEPIPCFLKGTRVLTPKGYKAIETFKDGDLIVTADNRIVPVVMSKKTIDETTSRTAPYRIPKNFFGKGMPSTDVDISPHHSIMIRPNVWAMPRMLAKQDSRIKQINVCESVDYYHLEAPNYLTDNMVVEGMIVETYGDKYRGQYVYYYSQKEGGLLRLPVNIVQNKRH